MTSVVKTEEQIGFMRESAKLLSRCLEMLVSAAKPGVSGSDLDLLAETFIRDHGASPAFKNYASAPGFPGFPGSICFSRNHVVVHGIPRPTDIIEEGDLITIDCGLDLKGWFADAARLFIVGEGSEEDKKLVKATTKALHAGIKACKAGNKLGDVCSAIQVSAGLSSFHNVVQFCGHAIGTKMHEAPQVPNHGKAGTGMELVPGMVFCLEPMLLKRRVGLGVLSDKWTIVTLDGSRATHIEHMVHVTEKGPEILSAPEDSDCQA